MNISERIILAPEEETTINRWSQGKRFPLRLVQRAQIIQLAAQGVYNHDIAKSLDIFRPTVQLWRERFLSLRLDGLEKDAPRPGRFPKISYKKVTAIVNATLHTTPPNATHWSARSMAKEQRVSETSIRRIWKQYNLKPHLVKKSKLSRDKKFLEKLYDIVGLYMNPPAKAIVLCVDEKSQIQALERTQPLLPLHPGIPARQTHDYMRHGTTTLFAALNMLNGTVIGDCMPRHRCKELLDAPHYDTMTMTEPILQIKDLKTYFYTSEGVAKAVDGISYSVNQGETLGLVGESGCGKTVSALSILRLIQEPPGRIVDGEILFEDNDLLKLSPEEIRKIRGNRISMIFQEPMTALNPVFTIGNQISEAFTVHKGLSRREAMERSIEMLKVVGIPAPERIAYQYPHQLSGGMRQRVMIAMALACNPKILIADEPTTALDVTIQAQILDLMIKLKEEFGSAIILITHDLGIIADTAKNVVIMYAGKIAEKADVKTIFANPLHPYTQGLLKSVPRVDKAAENHKIKRRLQEIPGIVPSLYNLPKGCYFHPRCPFVMDICREKEPELKSAGDGHSASCWLVS